MPSTIASDDEGRERSLAASFDRRGHLTSTMTMKSAAAAGLPPYFHFTTAVGPMSNMPPSAPRAILNSA